LKELFPEIVGESPKLLAALEQTKRAAVSTLPVVIYGETGVGKELFARAIHRLSNRKGQFLAWNATSMTVELADATLFGHSKGAFTGATQSRNGYLLSCNGGTLFIDELDSLDPQIQGKLLRVLDGGDFFPVGSDEPIRVDVRLITASHHPLKTLVERKLFRNDLYFRLEGAWVFIPPLRERKEDIRLLVDHFLRLCSRDSNGLVAPNLSLTEDAWARLFAHSWPGNVRELGRVVCRAAFAARGSVIDAEDIDLGPPEDSHPEYDAFAQKLQELASLCIARQQGVSEASTTFKRALAEQALQAANGKRAAAARMLQMTHSNFSRLLRTLGLEGENSRRG
jgi:DNA-binding NtrC family response regulator